MSARGRTPAWACAALVLSALPARAGDPADAVRAVLRRNGAHDGRGVADVTRELAGLGPEAVPLLHELALGVGIERLAPEEWDPHAWVCAPEELAARAHAALLTVPAAPLHEHLRRFLDGAPPATEVAGVLRLLASRGDVDGMELVLRAAAALDELALHSPSIRAALRDAFVALIRDGALARGLAAKPHDLGPAAPVLVEALGASDVGAAATPLERLHFAGGALAVPAVEALACLERARPWELAGRTLGACVHAWDDPDPAERARVARLCGELGGAEEAFALLVALEDPDPIVSAVAQGALVALAGGPHGADAESWEAWLASEHAWKEARWPLLAEALTGDDPGASNAALRELLGHALFRHEAAEVVAASLARLHPVVAERACRELGRLGSLHAVPGLREALDDGPEGTRRAARAALRTLQPSGAPGDDAPLLLPWIAR